MHLERPQQQLQELKKKLSGSKMAVEAAAGRAATSTVNAVTRGLRDLPPGADRDREMAIADLAASWCQVEFADDGLKWLGNKLGTAVGGLILTNLGSLGYRWWRRKK
jgi:hypothetical protein